MATVARYTHVGDRCRVSLTTWHGFFRGIVFALLSWCDAVDGIACVLLDCVWPPGAASEPQPCMISVTIHAGPRALVAGRGQLRTLYESAAIPIYSLLAHMLIVGKLCV